MQHGRLFPSRRQGQAELVVISVGLAERVGDGQQIGEAQPHPPARRPAVAGRLQQWSEEVIQGTGLLEDSPDGVWQRRLPQRPGRVNGLSDAVGHGPAAVGHAPQPLHLEASLGHGVGVYAAQKV